MNAAVLQAAVDAGTTRLPPEVRATQVRLHANVVTVSALPGRAAAGGAAGFVAGLGDGAVVAIDAAGIDKERFVSHDAAITGMAVGGDTLYTTGQDGRLYAHRSGGTADLLAGVSGRWLTCPKVAPDGARLAFACGKRVTVLPIASGMDLEFADHPSTVSSLCFSPDGRQLAVSHYCGVTVWQLDGSNERRVLEWKGSHIAVSWSPDGRFVISATQERELHVWDLVTAKDYRLGGYPSKVHSLAWTDDGRRLACSGADVITVWPLGAGGPGAMPPLEIGYVYSGRVACVAAHPSEPVVAGGYSDGTVLVGGIVKGEAAFARIADGDPVTALAWAGDKRVLAAATRSGTVAVVAVDELVLK